MLPALADRFTPLWRALEPADTVLTVMLPALAVTLMSLPMASVPEVTEVSRMLPPDVTFVDPLATDVVRPPFSEPVLLRYSEPAPVTVALTLLPALPLTMIGASSEPMPLAAVSWIDELAPVPLSVTLPARMLPVVAVRASVLFVP